jgi:hypothetical protein
VCDLDVAFLDREQRSFLRDSYRLSQESNSHFVPDVYRRGPDETHLTRGA